MVELDIKEDIVKENTLKCEEDKWRRRGIANSEQENKEISRREGKNSKVTVMTNQTPTPFKVEVRHFSNWRELKWCANFSHDEAAPPTHAPCLQYVSFHE